MDIQEDNIIACRARLRAIMEGSVEDFPKYATAIEAILNANIICCDALTAMRGMHHEPMLNERKKPLKDESGNIIYYPEITGFHEWNEEELERLCEKAQRGQAMIQPIHKRLGMAYKKALAPRLKQHRVVLTHKSSLNYTKVDIYSGSDKIEFTVSAVFQDLLDCHAISLFTAGAVCANYNLTEIKDNDEIQRIAEIMADYVTYLVRFVLAMVRALQNRVEREILRTREDIGRKLTGEENEDD